MVLHVLRGLLVKHHSRRKEGKIEIKLGVVLFTIRPKCREVKLEKGRCKRAKPKVSNYKTYLLVLIKGELGIYYNLDLLNC